MCYKTILSNPPSIRQIAIKHSYALNKRNCKKDGGKKYDEAL